MACLNPRRSQIDADGVVYFGETENGGSEFQDFEVSCGRCHECYARTKRDTAIRCVHEAEEYRIDVELPDGVPARVGNSCFVTLTYDPEHLPEGESVDLAEWQGFMQRLRNRFRGQSIRYVSCGEYGTKGRPHYHGILFGVSFHGDRQPVRRGDDAAFSSPTLDDVWGKGRTEIGPVNYATAAYVAGYVVKKAYDEAVVRRPHDEEAFTFVSDPSGKVRKVRPEFSTRSTGRGETRGLGYRWICRNYRSVYERDEVRLDGGAWQVPRYYDRVLEELDPGLFWEVVTRRRDRAREREVTPSTVSRSRKVIFEAKLGQREQRLS